MTPNFHVLKLCNAQFAYVINMCRNPHPQKGSPDIKVWIHMCVRMWISVVVTYRLMAKIDRSTSVSASA